MTTIELARYVMAERGLNTAYVSLLQLFTRRTGALLRWQRQRGILRSVKDPKHGNSIFGKSRLKDNHRVTIFCHNGRMSNEDTLALRQIDQARGDLYAIESDLQVIQAQLARLPTGKEMAQTILLATLTGAAIILAGIEALSR